jgi:single-stranded DNA-binding protein
MIPSINKVFLMGQLSKHGVEVSFIGQGTAKACFMLITEDMGADGRGHQTWHKCEVYGKHAEAASDVPAGTLCLFEGRVRNFKRGETWETLFTGWELRPVTLPAVEVPA